jgi:phosphoribosylaminoimidazole-succinocarboxamide synthase
MGIKGDIQSKGKGNIFNKITAEIFLHFEKEKVIMVQETFRTPKRKETRHVRDKTLNVKNKERILKPSKEKQQITNKGKSIRIAAAFSMETLKARITWNDIFQALEENNCQPKLWYPGNFSFIIEVVLNPSMVYKNQRNMFPLNQHGSR